MHGKKEEGTQRDSDGLKEKWCGEKREAEEGTMSTQANLWPLSLFLSVKLSRPLSPSFISLLTRTHSHVDREEEEEEEEEEGWNGQ